ncbi:MAG: hypothetical protein ACOX5T_02535 [Candidatus Cryptobacteroides sp.]|jgi:hypothetical protein
MNNKGYFQFSVSEEQISYALQLARHSIENHPIRDIYAEDKRDTYGLSADERSLRYRFTGTLGEVLFADVYNQPRPSRAFGAIDGQDSGQDFQFNVNGKNVILDIKTMNRNNSILYDYYVLDLPAYQIEKNYLTDAYFHITLIPCDRINFSGFEAAFVGFIYKNDIPILGTLFSEGSLRPNNRGRSVLFSRATYEIKLCDLLSPPIPADVVELRNFQIMTIKVGQRRPF